MEYWCINDDYKPQWVQDLIDRRLLIHQPTPMSDCYTFYQTEMTTSPIHLYDGDGLCYSNNKIGVIYDLYSNFKKLKERILVIKYYCDMCGKEIFDKNDMYEVKLSKKNNDSVIYGDCVTILMRKDICENCFNKMKDMLKRRIKD